MNKLLGDVKVHVPGAVRKMLIFHHMLSDSVKESMKQKNKEKRNR